MDRPTILFIWLCLMITTCKGSPPSGGSSGGSSGGGTTSVKSVPAYSRSLEETLRKTIFAGYEVLQRPQQLVNITVSLSMITVNELSIRDQVLSLTGFFTFEWEDVRLPWNNDSDYDNIKFLFSNEENVWRPPIIIENSVEDVSVLSDKNVPMRISADGYVSWSPTGIFKVACEADTTFYPMDVQTCVLTITPWAYTNTEIALGFNDNNGSMNLDYYSENGEWELISTSYAVSAARTRNGQSFEGLNFELKLRRRPMFHVLNTLFPVVLMAMLTTMVFKLPVESGEKIGFALTVLLAYAVYLSLISESIPSTSVTICYLSVYLAFILVLGSVSVLATIFVINVSFQPEDKPIPRWMKIFIMQVLAKAACHNGQCCCMPATKTRVYPSKTEMKTTILSQDVVVEAFDEPEIVKSSRQRNTSKTKPRNGKDHVTVEKKAPQPPSSEVTPRHVVPDFKAPDEEEIDELTWKEVGFILDKFFFVVFMLAVVVSTAILFFLIFAEWLNVTVDVR